MKPKRKPGRPKSKVPLALFSARVEEQHADEFHARRKQRKVPARVIFAEMIGKEKP